MNWTWTGVSAHHDRIDEAINSACFGLIFKKNIPQNIILRDLVL
jgi:hypothetical protein